MRSRANKGSVIDDIDSDSDDNLNRENRKDDKTVGLVALGRLDSSFSSSSSNFLQSRIPDATPRVSSVQMNGVNSEVSAQVASTDRATAEVTSERRKNNPTGDILCKNSPPDVVSPGTPPSKYAGGDLFGYDASSISLDFASLTLNPGSQRCDSDDTPVSSRKHLLENNSAHLRQNSTGSQTMSIWSRSHSILGAGGEINALVDSPTSPFFDHSCLLSSGSCIFSPLATSDSEANGLLMTMDKVPPTAVEIPEGRKQPTKRPSRASESSGSLSTGLLRSSLASMNRPHPYVQHTRQLSSPLYSTTGLAHCAPSNYDQHSAPSFDVNLEAYLEDLSVDVLSSPGSAPVASILDPRPQSQSRRRTKAQGEGFQERASTSLDEFTPSQLPAAVAIINYQQQHPGTPIPTAFITSELAEIKDGKGRCLVGSCASSTAAPKRADHLHEHIRDRHFNYKPYRCEDCPQSFSREHDLKRHQSVHRRDQSPCPVCSNIYTRVDNLNRHVRTKHPTFDMRLSSSAGARSSTRSASVITSSSML
ncbi:hypothetical protein FRB91_001862 [Serendipita sp. 411]|nr:hypothetical protein FRB91_001862 [Serendipita sp. 411]KAG9046680.1 hypothetical protein FS842_000830 [Serendipita sp. 407]